MNINKEWNVDLYKTEHESDEHWQLRRKFMLVHKDKFPEQRLVCLSQAFVNVELLECRYSENTMQLIASLSKGVADDYHQIKKNRLRRTFVKASDAAKDAKVRRSHNKPSKAARAHTRSHSKLEGSDNIKKDSTQNEKRKNNPKITFVEADDKFDPFIRKLQMNTHCSETASYSEATTRHAVELHSKSTAECSHSSSLDPPEIKAGSATNDPTRFGDPHNGHVKPSSTSSKSYYKQYIEATPYGKLVLMERVYQSMCPLEVIRETVRLCQAQLEYKFMKGQNVNAVECKIHINRKMLSVGEGKSKKLAKQLAAQNGIPILKRYCCTLKEKVPFLSNTTILKMQPVLSSLNLSCKKESQKEGQSVASTSHLPGDKKYHNESEFGASSSGLNFSLPRGEEPETILLSDASNSSLPQGEELQSEFQSDALNSSLPQGEEPETILLSDASNSSLPQGEELQSQSQSDGLNSSLPRGEEPETILLSDVSNSSLPQGEELQSQSQSDGLNSSLPQGEEPETILLSDVSNSSLPEGEELQSQSQSETTSLYFPCEKKPRFGCPGFNFLCDKTSQNDETSFNFPLNRKSHKIAEGLLAPLGESNIGTEMLMKMGWSGGGLGKNSQGIREPLDIQNNVKRAGLGLRKKGKKVRPTRMGLPIERNPNSLLGLPVGQNPNSLLGLPIGQNPNSPLGLPMGQNTISLIGLTKKQKKKLQKMQNRGLASSAGHNQNMSMGNNQNRFSGLSKKQRRFLTFNPDIQKTDTAVKMQPAAYYRKLIREYANSNSEYDLVFSTEFTNEERKAFHEFAQSYKLKTKSYGKNDSRYMVISKQVNFWKTIDQLIKCGGSSERYELVKPLEAM